MIHGTEAISHKKRHWILPQAMPRAADVAATACALACHPLVARLLLTRQITDLAEAREFIHPQFKNLHPPETIPGMTAAAERIAAAIHQREKMTIYGDYDVDGITGTAMLWRLLKMAGADFDVYIPHRVDEGYGISCKALQQLAQKGTQLLVSVDCGITAIEPIAQARRAGMDVVVTDHHEMGDTLPEANVLVHPGLDSTGQANRHLCGAGVAYKLAWAIGARLCNSPRLTGGYRSLMVEFSALVALATIADVVPLTGENRLLARFGLAQLPRSSLVGIQALISAAGLTNKTIDGTAVGFLLAPRLNAAGRMDHASEAVELLTTDDAARATELADYLEEQNMDRQGTERKITAAALKMARESRDMPPAIVLCSQDWHAGVVGIVASRLVDAFNRPTFILSQDGAQAAGSGRSIKGIPLHEAIEFCRDLLISGGGHAAAGGVRLESGKVEAFRQRLCEFVRNHYPQLQFAAALDLDGELTEADLDLQAVRELENLAPFGCGNPRPKFLIAGARLATAPRRMGAAGGHLQLQLRIGTQTARAVAFRMGLLEPYLPVGLEIDLVVEPRIDTYKGRTRLDLHVVDLRRSDGRFLEPIVQTARTDIAREITPAALHPTV